MQIRVETLAEVKRIKFGRFDTIFCVETEKEYYLEPNGSGLTPDDDDYIQAAHGDDYRYVSMEARGSGGGGGGGGGGVSANIAIYDPDIATTAGNRYKTWAEVMAAVATWGTVGGELVVRKSGISQIATVPAGNYDLSSCYVRSDASSIVPTLSFDAGTTISGFPRIIEGVAIRNNNTAAPLHTVSGFGISILRNASLVNGASATQPLLSVPSGSNFTLTFDTIVSPLYKQGSSEPVFIEGSLFVDILRLSDNSFFSKSDLFTNNLTGNGILSITSYVLLPSGYTPSHANYDGNLNLQQKSETRVIELIGENAGPAAREYLYGTWVDVPIPVIRKGLSNEAPTDTFAFTINPGDPIQDRRVIVIEAQVYVGSITGGVLSDRVYKVLAKFTRNGAINALDKDMQIVASSPSAGGPSCTITAYDDGAGHVGLSVQNNSTNTIRIVFDMSGRVVDDASRGPYFNS